MNIVFLDTKTMGNVSNFQLLENLGNYTAYPMSRYEDLTERLKNADILITCKVNIDKKYNYIVYIIVHFKFLFISCLV